MCFCHAAFRHTLVVSDQQRFRRCHQFTASQFIEVTVLSLSVLFNVVVAGAVTPASHAAVASVLSHGSSLTAVLFNVVVARGRWPLLAVQVVSAAAGRSAAVHTGAPRGRVDRRSTADAVVFQGCLVVVGRWLNVVEGCA